MNTLMNMVISYLKKEVIQSKSLCFLALFLVVGWGHSQSVKVKVDLEKLYKSRLEEHLFPQIDTLIEKEVVLFFAKPSFNPEYSIRIVERGNQSFIEGRFLEKNLWTELFEHLEKHDDKPFSLNVSFYSKLISDNFKDRMLSTITNVIHDKKINDKMPVDGISYDFWIFDKRERVQSVEVNSPESGTIEDKIANLCTQMINDLKDQSFEETKYIGNLN